MSNHRKFDSSVKTRSSAIIAAICYNIFMILLEILMALVALILLASLVIFLIIEGNWHNPIPQYSENHPLWQDGLAMMSKIEETEWEMTTRDGLRLKAWYAPAERPTDKTVIVANGYHSIRDRFPGYCYLFHKLGYNVLIPAYRASAESQGRFIGFGWKDRDDYKRWMHAVIERNPLAKICMAGISMGAATTMMTAGEPDLPDNIKCFIEDCGYDSVFNGVAYVAKFNFHLPKFPFIYLLSFWSKILAGYGYKTASSVKQLAKNRRPMLFIHGADDTYVPTFMIHKNFAATQGPKEMLIVEGAKHAASYETNPELYGQTVKAFLDKYFK